MSEVPTPHPYAAVWKRAESLESLNARIHDGVPTEMLRDRADQYRRRMFEELFPVARPAGGTALELGSGVGWILESMLEAYPLQSVIGLDLSENMIRRARERVADPRMRFVHYDGLRIPLADASVPVIYSCAVIQHIEKHAAFLVLSELVRILAPRGHAVLHFLGIDHLPAESLSYSEECWYHVTGTPAHWHHYYTFDELFVLFANLLKVSDLDIRHDEGCTSFYVHFSRDTGRPFLRPELPSLTYRARSRELPTWVRALAGRLRGRGDPNR